MRAQRPLAPATATNLKPILAVRPPARSIKYQKTIAKLPLAKDLAEFDFNGTPINEGLVKDLASGAFIASQRNAVLVGDTGIGKTHLAIAIARACI